MLPGRAVEGRRDWAVTPWGTMRGSSSSPRSPFPSFPFSLSSSSSSSVSDSFQASRKTTSSVETRHNRLQKTRSTRDRLEAPNLVVLDEEMHPPILRPPRWRSERRDLPDARGVLAVSPVYQRISLKKSADYVDDGLDCYDLSGPRKAFLMCMKKKRPGAVEDVRLMKRWLNQCGFESTLCIDPEKREFFHKLESFRDGLQEDGISCCLVSLMAHGGNGFIKMKCGNIVSLEDVFEMFNNKNCPALHEKPRIFIIQACRGKRRDNGVETDEDDTDSDENSMDSDNESTDSEDEPKNYSYTSKRRRLPTASDYFIVYPTLADHVALRNPHTGSRMIEAMAEVFDKYGNRCHIADFFTKSRVHLRLRQPQAAARPGLGGAQLPFQPKQRASKFMPRAAMPQSLLTTPGDAN